MTPHKETICATVSCNLDRSLLETCLPLFEKASIDALEWSFDTLYNVKHIPDWFVELLQTYSQQGRLIGHGVYFSLFSGKWSAEQQNWLNHLQKVSRAFHFDHITEHFGFMTGSDFHKGAPLSIPYSASTLRIGQDRLKRIYEACGRPVGLENLAFSYSLEEVKKHGEFLNDLIAPVNGFIILDLHNLYCQLENFSMEFEALIRYYPLDRVREIHLSGGSWDHSALAPTGKVRRDTHDDAVPEAVFDLLEKVLPHCPNLKFVVLEQIGNTLNTPAIQAQFRSDYETMKNLIDAFQLRFESRTNNTFLPLHAFELSSNPEEDQVLYEQQRALSEILEKASGVEEAKKLLDQSPLNHSDWHVDTWSPYMLETALKIAQKWKGGW